MNIGVDFDGVLFDSENMFRAYAQLYNLSMGRTDMPRPEELYTQYRYDWDRKEYEDYIYRCIGDIQKTAPIMPYAKEVLSLLAKKHNIYFISARGNLTDEEIKITNKRLSEEKVPYTEVFYSTKDKLEVCKKLKIELMIEDLYKTVLPIAESGIKCLYYRDLVLKFSDHPNIREVRNWGDICVECVKMGLLTFDDVKGLVDIHK